MFSFDNSPPVIRKYDPCDISRAENIAIPLSYFSIGFADSFITTPLNIYMVSVLNAEPPIQTTLGILQTLPWSLKLLFGFISDAFPIAGAHRKPYLIMGSIIYSGAFILYSMSASDNVMFLAFCIFLGTVGLIQMDVMTDTMVVERSKFEKEAVRGQMQASCYAIRFGGSVAGALLGAAVCNKKAWGWGLDYKEVSFVNGIIPFIVIAPYLWQLKEKYRKKPKSNSPFTSGLDLIHMHDQHEIEQEVTSEVTKEASLKEEEKVSLLRSTEQSNNSNVIGNVRRVKFHPMEVSQHDIEARVTANMAATSATATNYGTMDSSLPAPVPLSSSSNMSNDLTSLNNNETGGDDGDDANNGYQFSLRSNPTEYVVVEALNDPIRQQLTEIWETVQLKAVWRPMVSYVK